MAWLAQSVEHETLNLRVVGSSPTSGADDSRLIEYDKVLIYITMWDSPGNKVP